MLKKNEIPDDCFFKADEKGGTEICKSLIDTFTKTEKTYKIMMICAMALTAVFICLYPAALHQRDVYLIMQQGHPISDYLTKINQWTDICSLLYVGSLFLSLINIIFYRQYVRIEKDTQALTDNNFQICDGVISKVVDSDVPGQIYAGFLPSYCSDKEAIRKIKTKCYLVSENTKEYDDAMLVRFPSGYETLILNKEL